MTTVRNINFKDLTGQRFGRLVPFEVVPNDERPKPYGTYWKCHCDCGRDCVIRAADLQQGRVNSCKCLRNTLMGMTDEERLARSRKNRNAAMKRYRDKYRERFPNPPLALRFTEEELAERRAKYQENQQRWRHEKGRKWRILKHGISVGRYEEILTEQVGVCAICSGPQVGHKRRFSIDHDHDCCPGKYGCEKCIRGLLCDPCNQALGSFKNNEDVLLAAVMYVKKWIAKKKVLPTSVLTGPGVQLTLSPPVLP